MMYCMVCGEDMRFYFSKNFGGRHGLYVVSYYKCRYCGFVSSKTHLDMGQERWEELNKEFHTFHPLRNKDGRHFQKALMLHLMMKQDIIQYGRWLDWGSGDGNLSLISKQYFDINLMSYDKYFVPKTNPITLKYNLKRDLVTCTAVFEHIRDRATLDDIESNVKNNGCFAIHTVVPESIPKNPNWSYLLPAHCSFFTNKSMQILMDQWKYTCSVYSPLARLWVWFREIPDLIEPKIDKLNEVIGSKQFFFKKGFMNYWGTDYER